MSFIFRPVNRLLGRPRNISIFLGFFTFMYKPGCRFLPQLLTKENKTNIIQEKKTEEEEVPKEETKKIGAEVEEGSNKAIRGLRVCSIMKNSLAAKSGLKRGDIIIEVNNMTIISLDDYKEAVKKIGNEQMILMIIRDGFKRFIEIPPKHMNY